MLKVVIICAIGLVAVHATPLLSDDAKEREKEADIDSSRNLNEFVEAWKNNDTDKIINMLDYAVNRAQDCEKITSDMADRYNRVLSYMMSLVDTPEELMAFAQTLHGNRDYSAYYSLETVIEWIIKRQDAGVQDKRFSMALSGFEESQASEEIIANTFEATVGTLAQDTSNTLSVLQEARKICMVNSFPFKSGAAGGHKVLRNIRQSIQPYP